MSPNRLAAALLGALALAACSMIDRDEPEPAAAAAAVDPLDPDAVRAEARRILQTRSFARLRTEVEAAEIRAITDLVVDQVFAWNRGDLESFMDAYWRSDDLRFASGSTPVRGWAEALRQYRRDYPDRADMGELAFSDLEINILAPDAATVFGRWRLAQVSDTPAGLFTLVLRKIDGRWLIIHDHTSTGV